MLLSSKLLLLFCSLVLPVGCSDAKLHTSMNPAIKNYSWANKPFIGDDSQFLTAKSQIDNDLKRGVKPETLLQELRNASQRNPKDVIAAYRWGYIASIAAADRAGFAYYATLNGASDAMALSTAPASPEYMRVRFLVNGGIVPLKQLGERLLKRYPDDRLVKGNLANICAFSLRHDHDDPSTKAEALRLIDELRSTYPSDPKYIAWCGNVYYVEWTIRQSQKDANTAIKYFDRFLSADHGRDPERISVVLEMEKEIKNWLGQ